VKITAEVIIIVINAVSWVIRDVLGRQNQTYANIKWVRAPVRVKDLE